MTTIRENPPAAGGLIDRVRDLIGKALAWADRGRRGEERPASAGSGELAPQAVRVRPRGSAPASRPASLRIRRAADDAVPAFLPSVS